MRLVPLALLLLAACGSRSDPQPGEVSASEDRQLDQAAAATDINAASANDTEPSQ
jgi:hypothetical protein